MSIMKQNDTSKPKPTMPRVTGRLAGQVPWLVLRRNNFKRVRDRISGNSNPLYSCDKIHMDTVSDSGCADLQFYSGSDSESEDSFYEIDSSENECYEPSFQKSPGNSEIHVEKQHEPHNISDKHVAYEISETHGGGENVGEKIDEKINRPHNGSDKHVAYENSETHSEGEIDGENDKHEGYENSITHSEGEIDGENDKHEGYENSETHSVGEIDGENEGYENSKTHSEGEINGENDKHSGFECSETHSEGEIDGENIVEKTNNLHNRSDKHEINTENTLKLLKRKLETEQQRLRLLQKELDEERNASAIAADEAMAMITRLQEEKAALHMEASQYLRMMDEQAEYDMDALTKANDLVTEKDVQIQDLESELDYFRNRYENELFNANCFKSFKRTKSVFGLEDERKYILESLADLERKMSGLNGGKSEVDVENEIAGINERVEALENDRDFIEHACNMVESHGGVEFIREIAQHLRDLRRARFD